MKKIMSVLMLFTILFSFAACSNGAGEGDTKVWYFNHNETDPEAIFTNVQDSVDPNRIFSSVQFDENMLHGTYVLNNLEKDIGQAEKDLTFQEVSLAIGTYNISSLPVAVYNGAKYLPDLEGNFRQVEDREVAVLGFIKDGKIATIPCSYEVSANKVKYTVLTETGSSAEDFSYEVDGAAFEYEFSLCGPYLTLTDGTDTLKLTAYSFTENNKSETTMHGYSTEKTPLIDELDYFASQQDSLINYAVSKDGSYYKNSAFKLSDDGRCTVYLSYTDAQGKEQNVIRQYAYIAQCSGYPYLNSFGIMLFDEGKIYDYTDDVTEREARILKSEGIDTDALDEETIKEIAEKKEDLYDALYNEFKANGITVQINRSTGEIAMDATVLFGGDSAELTDEGKEFLNKFIKAYTSIIYDEKYDGFIAKTIVEGHIAPISGATYESGMPLSEQRAKNVKDYCLSGETGADTSKLAATMETVGYSQSRPVYDADGNVDIEACRRVSFRFVVNIDAL